MSVDAGELREEAVASVQNAASRWALLHRVGARLSWGMADQALSSVTNFVVSLYIARTLGAVSYGAFSLAFLTYTFALNASRGLATDPLLVRFSGTDVGTWKRAVAGATGTAMAVGLVLGACLVVVALALMHGSTKLAFVALGLILPGLLLQDSWRYSFFALGRGGRAVVNDALVAAALVPTLIALRATGHADVFWYVLAWGGVAVVGAVFGPFQARVTPRLLGTRAWLSEHSDLGPRYLLEGTSNSASGQLCMYGVGGILGLASVGYLEAASMLMGPFTVVFFGMGLVALPEAARALRRSARQMMMFCALLGAGLSLLALAWGTVLLVAIPRGLGHLVLGSLWRPTYPLVLPMTVFMMAACSSATAAMGLHALGASRRSLRAMVLWSAIYVFCGVIGGVLGGTVGAVRGMVVAGGIGVLLFWRELRAGLREHAQRAG